MSTQDRHLYVQTDKAICRLNISTLLENSSSNNEFELLHDFSDRKLPMKMPSIVVNSTLFFIGGVCVESGEEEHLTNDTKWDPKLTHLDTFVCDPTNGEGDGSCIRQYDGSIPCLGTLMIQPIVVTLEKKTYFLEQSCGEFPVCFQVFDHDRRIWRYLDPLFVPPEDRLFVSHYAWHNKIAFFTEAEVFIFNTTEEKWCKGSDIEARLPLLSCATEYNGYLIGMRSIGEIVCYELNEDNLPHAHYAEEISGLEGIFKYPFSYCCSSFITCLGDDRILFLYSGLDQIVRGGWYAHLVVFQVSIGMYAGKRFIYAVPEVTEIYEFDNFKLEKPHILSTFVMCDIDVEAWVFNDTYLYGFDKIKENQSFLSAEYLSVLEDYKKKYGEKKWKGARKTSKHSSNSNLE